VFRRILAGLSDATAKFRRPAFLSVATRPGIQRLKNIVYVGTLDASP
jgi:hypothetical protein